MKLLHTFCPALLLVPLWLIGCADIASCERTATCSPEAEPVEAGIETNDSDGASEGTGSEGTDSAGSTPSDNAGTSVEQEPVHIPASPVPFGPTQPPDAGPFDGSEPLDLDAATDNSPTAQPDASSLSDGSAPPETVEPEPSTPAIFSIVIGVSGLAGNLSLSVGAEDIEVTINGDVEVPGFADGATYVVSVVANPANQACTVSNGEGAVAGADVVDVFVDCANDVATLESLSLADVPTLPAFTPTDLDYSAEVGLFVQTVTLNATLTDPLATLSVNGDVVVSPAVLDLPLSLGENSVEVEVTAPSGKTEQYVLAVTRRENVVRHEILAPNAASVEGFGNNLSVSGDFMFVDRFVEVNTGPQAFLFQYVDGAWAYLTDVETLIDGPVYTIDGGVLCGDTLLVLAAPTSGTTSVALYVLRNNNGWHHEQTFTVDVAYTDVIACDSGTVAVGTLTETTIYALGGQGLQFVQSLEVVGSVSIDGDTMVIGDTAENSAASGVNGNSVYSCPEVNCRIGSGAAYVYERNPLGLWQFAAYLKGFDGWTGGGFGNGVDVSGDWIAVGAFADSSAYQGVSSEVYEQPACTGPDDTTCVYRSGAAFVYRREELGWTEEAYVKPVGLTPDAFAGWHVHLRGDLLVLDATGAGSNYEGAAYLFARESSGWYQTNLVFTPEAPGTNDFFPRDADMTERGYFGTTVYRESGQDQVVWFE